MDDLVEAVGRLVTAGNSPQMYLEDDGLVPFPQRVTEWMDKVGPELKVLIPDCGRWPTRSPRVRGASISAV
ncbi:hypothetical protein ACQPXH_27795 [Nocardia sp. CA-135953]|uniref:hypothetical protein n=1 Tax=Nocardia sp. CA-135953 TaxID=3239978 RepID=UPI003D990DFA